MAMQIEGDSTELARASLDALRRELSAILDGGEVVKGARLSHVVDVYLRAAIAAHDGNSSAAAETLGVDRGTLHRKLTRKPKRRAKARRKKK